LTRKRVDIEEDIMAAGGRPIANGNLRHVNDDFGLSASPSIATKAMFDMEVGGCPMRRGGQR